MLITPKSTNQRVQTYSARVALATLVYVISFFYHSCRHRANKWMHKLDDCVVGVLKNEDLNENIICGLNDRGVNEWIPRYDIKSIFVNYSWFLIGRLYVIRITLNIKPNGLNMLNKSTRTEASKLTRKYGEPIKLSSFLWERKLKWKNL